MHFSNLKNSILSTVKDFCCKSEAGFWNVQLLFEFRFLNVKITAVSFNRDTETLIMIEIKKAIFF